MDNNWRLFATLVNLGLKSVGEPFDAEITTAAFRRVDEFHHGGGWYADGPGDAAFDHYNPWAIHFYGLLNAALGGCDTEAADTVRQRARDFAPEYLRWFAADGAGLAFGRSLTYRFAQAAFFGAMAFADEPGPGWGVLRGAWARQIRSWSGRPVLNGDGTLSIGYAYPSLLMSEQYNAAGSPYWALKAFCRWHSPRRTPSGPIRKSRSHPSRPPSTSNRKPGSFSAGHIRPRHCPLCRARPARNPAQRGEVPQVRVLHGLRLLRAHPADRPRRRRSRLDARAERGRRLLAPSTDDVDRSVDGEELVVRWCPWPDVEIKTRLSFDDGRQLRRHRITTRRALHTVEGVFCVPLGDDAPEETVTAGSALAVSGGKASGIRDTTGVRHGAVLRPDPNGHLLWPRTLLPVLRGELQPGEHELTTLVYANSTGDTSGC